MSDKFTKTIKAVSVKEKANGKIGFLGKEDDTWYNVNAEEPALDDLLKSIIQKGNVIEFEMDLGIPRNFILKEKAKETEDDMISFEDLLDKAYTKFTDRFSIETKMIRVDFEKKHALCHAIINIFANEEQTKKYVLGEASEESRTPVRLKIAQFEAYGDATQENCGDLVKKHWIRMAETRAIARALRWATNNAKTAKEETEN